METNDTRKNMVMVTVAIPDATDQYAIQVKKSIEDVLQDVDNATIEIRIRNAKDGRRGLLE